jgi:uncharacterized protein
VCRQASISAACDLVDTHLEHNGNDAVALSCGAQTYDVIGQIGVDPGAGGWGTNPSTLNTTLTRQCSVTTGDPDGTNTFDPAIEWTGAPQDTFSGLGSHCGP